MQVAAPGDVDVWVGLDVGKSEHFADVLDNDGNGCSPVLLLTTRRIWRRCWTARRGTARQGW